MKELGRVDFDPGLRELVRIRASQLNGCAYCVDTHTQDARSAGESEQRLGTVAVWHESPFLTARERVALAFYRDRHPAGRHARTRSVLRRRR